MMEIYTVSFFGHRYLERQEELESRLDSILRELIMQKEYIEFLVGREGDFDLLASSAVKRALRRSEGKNARFTLVLPYMKAEFRDNEKSYLDYYDEVEICEKSAKAHPKSAIQIRNQSIIDRSDLVICCIQHKSGGAYRAMRYAQKQGKKTVNIADENSGV